LIAGSGGAKAFRNNVRELKRLEVILASGKKGRDPKQPDVYDRMVLERRGVNVAPGHDLHHVANVHHSQRQQAVCKHRGVAASSLSLEKKKVPPQKGT